MRTTTALIDGSMRTFLTQSTNVCEPTTSPVGESSELSPLAIVPTAYRIAMRPRPGAVAGMARAYCSCVIVCVPWIGSVSSSSSSYASTSTRPASSAADARYGPPSINPRAASSETLRPAATAFTSSSYQSRLSDVVISRCSGVKLRSVKVFDAVL